MHTKAVTQTFLLTVFILGSFLLLWLYLRDPLQLFHKHQENFLVSNSRHQVAGIINQYDFDSIILGNSMLENTSAAEASEIFGGNFKNLSIGGGHFNVRAYILDYALKKKNLKTVIYSLDRESLIYAPEYDTSNFDFLYDNNPFNDIKVYIQAKYLICSFYAPFCLKKVDKNRPNAWYNLETYSSRYGGLNNWFRSKNNPQMRDALLEVLEAVEEIKEGHTQIDKNLHHYLLRSYQYIDTYLLDFVAAHQKTEFIFIIPPYSRIKYALDAQYYLYAFERYKKNIRYLVHKSKQYPNLKIYGWGNESFLDDIANYKDLSHYQYTINSWMLNAIGNQKGLLTEENIDLYFKIFSQKALKYNLLEIGEKIDRYLYQ